MLFAIMSMCDDGGAFGHHDLHIRIRSANTGTPILVRVDHHLVAIAAHFQCALLIGSCGAGLIDATDMVLASDSNQVGFAVLRDGDSRAAAKIFNHYARAGGRCDLVADGEFVRFAENVQTSPFNTCPREPG
jgi:hypothetical protein